MKYLWLLFDGRYHTAPDRAIVYGHAESKKGAFKLKKEVFADDVVIIRYEMHGKQLLNPVEEIE